MNKKTYIAIGIATIAVVTGVALFVTANEVADDTNTSSNNQQTITTDQEPQPSSSATAENQSQLKPSEETATPPSDSYITLATYNSDPSELSDSTKVLFFHASWCSICKSIEDDIVADPSQIPTGTVFIKTDFDTNTELRKKYDVVGQYTFVQIDNDGNQIAKWSATSLDKAITGIQS